ncbi:hypothetical protein FB446DRAFT_734661 [Lentinula raphanica]|nr:hypothetical protein FB446DRAFT_734661 [Lentinula raphanica]
MVARQILVPLLIFGCILGFLTVQARPTPKVNPINQAYKQALSDNVARANWINLSRDTKYRFTCAGMKRNQLYFEEEGDAEIETLPLAFWKQGGENNHGIYNVTKDHFRLTGRKGLYEEKGDSKGAGGERTRYIVKLVDITSKEGESVASCEPHALDQVNIWHRTGIRKVEGEKFGAILMKLETGEDISENKMWLQADRTERHTVLEAIKVKTREKVYKYAFETATNTDHILATDFHRKNVLVQIEEIQIRTFWGGYKHGGIKVIEVIIIDWGYPGVPCTWTEKPTELEFNLWFNERFNLLWLKLYHL